MTVMSMVGKKFDVTLVLNESNLFTLSIAHFANIRALFRSCPWPNSAMHQTHQSLGTVVASILLQPIEGLTKETRYSENYLKWCCLIKRVQH